MFLIFTSFSLLRLEFRSSYYLTPFRFSEGAIKFIRRCSFSPFLPLNTIKEYVKARNKLLLYFYNSREK